MWSVRSSRTDFTINTIIKDTRTIVKSYITNFTNFFFLVEIWEMVSVTITIWDWASIGSTDGTVTI
jgi:hypothetical protein